MIQGLAGEFRQKGGKRRGEKGVEKEKDRGKKEKSGAGRGEDREREVVQDACSGQ